MLLQFHQWYKVCKTNFDIKTKLNTNVFLINYLTELPNENMPQYFVETINYKK